VALFTRCVKKGSFMKDMLKCCLNRKVIAGLAVVGVGLWALAPEALSAALPLLVFAVCPLSMLLMMKMMHGQQAGPTDNADQEPQPETASAPAQVTASRDSASRVEA
jgi:hypothetical protein